MDDTTSAGEEMVQLERPKCAAMDDLMAQGTIPVLDKGMIRVVDYMGDDAAVAQAARTSYGTGTKTVNEDRGLIRYLMSHWHTTPFEMCEIKLHVKLPVFVARQWVRHRTANINEYSARYSVLDREFYFPEPEQIAAQSQSNAQGREEVFDRAQALDVRQWIMDHSELSYNLYSNQLDDGLARELARMNLPLNIYTQWYWKVDVHNFMHFLRLRADPHAQYEIRVYAEALCEILKVWMPVTYEAFEDYRLNALQLSSMEYDLVQQMIDNAGKVDPASESWTKLSKREKKAFEDRFQPIV